MPTIPEFQVARARSMLASVKAETGFKENMPPLPFVRAVAERLGHPWGLNGKRGNAHDTSKDVLAYNVPGQQPILVDVLIDAGGQNGLTFNVLEYPQEFGAVFIPVGPFINTGQPSIPEQPVPTPGTDTPTPGTVPPAPDYGPQLAVIGAQLTVLTNLLGRVASTLDQLAERPAPIYRGGNWRTGSFTLSPEE